MHCSVVETVKGTVGTGPSNMSREVPCFSEAQFVHISM